MIKLNLKKKKDFINYRSKTEQKKLEKKNIQTKSLKKDTQEKKTPDFY